MAAVKSISIHTREPGVIKKVAISLVFWGLLVGATGISRIWFGGAWTIDLIVAALAVIVLIALSMKGAGSSVDMTKEEIADWVAAGMPDDVKSWRIVHRARAK